MTCRAISIKQPWATLIASGRKTIEVRTWRTHYRGPLVLVASKAPDVAACKAHDLDPRELAAGVTVALVDLVDVRRGRPNDAAAACISARGAWAWMLANVRRLQPVRMKGKLSLFWIEDRDVRIAP